jgi:uncharacterized protein YjbI with pentapeptide repeats
MKKPSAMMLTVLMIFSAIAGCLGGNSDGLESEIADLESQNSELKNLLEVQNESINEKNALIEAYVESSQSLAEQLNRSLANVTDLESQLFDAENYRDELFLLLESGNETTEGLQDDLDMAEAYINGLEDQLQNEKDKSSAIHQKLNESTDSILTMLSWPEQDDVDQVYLAEFLKDMLSNEENSPYLYALEWGVFIENVPMTVGYDSSAMQSGLDEYNMDHFDLSNTYLADWVFTIDSLSNANLSNANLSGAVLHSQSIHDSNFTNADLSYAEIVGDFSGNNFENSNLKMAAIASPTGQCANVNISQWYCISGHLFGPNSSVVEGWDFSHSVFRGPYITGKEIVDADLSFANLTNLRMYFGSFEGSNFTGANLTGAWIGGVDLTGVHGTNVTCPSGTFVEEMHDCIDGELIGPNTEMFDDDGDGVSEIDGDCDDSDSNTYPGAPEISDGEDNDCDGDIDEDYDGDGWTEWEGDCEDNDPNINPGATEVYDGLDNDCDGATDESDPNDSDGDGYTPQTGDCDDSNPNTYPGATEINDGEDNDCDGTVDEWW